MTQHICDTGEVNRLLVMADEGMQIVPGDVLMLARSHEELRRQFADEREKAVVKLGNACGLLYFFTLLSTESDGITGYHLNGDVAEWDEFEQIGESKQFLSDPTCSVALAIWQAREDDFLKARTALHVACDLLREALTESNEPGDALLWAQKVECFLSHYEELTDKAMRDLYAEIAGQEVSHAE